MAQMIKRQVHVFLQSPPESMMTQFTGTYHEVSNISHTLVGNWIVDHSDVVGASPVGAATTTSSFSTQHLASIYCTKTTASREEKHLSLGFGASYIKDFTVYALSEFNELTSLRILCLYPRPLRPNMVMNLSDTKNLNYQMHYNIIPLIGKAGSNECVYDGLVLTIL